MSTEAPPRRLFLTVFFDPGRLSSNRTRGKRWQKLRSEENAARDAALSAYTQAGFPVWHVPVTVDVIVRRAHRMDDDNLWAGLKCIRDVLFKDRITPDDDPRWVSCGTITQEISPQWLDREEALLIVREREVTP